jgi:glucokinase-like ROK family protein
MKKATRQKTKQHNTLLVLKTLYNGENLSRADVARITSLTRPTVSTIVSELIDDGLVAEIAVGPSAGGKPPILLGVIDDGRHLLGLDLANSEFRGAITNLRGEIRHRFSLPVDRRSGEYALELVYSLIDELLGATENPVLGIGIGSPGLMNAEDGIVRTAVNLDWHDLPLGDLLEERYDLPVYIANDCQVAAIAELTFGGSKTALNLILVKIGRGIGAGIIFNRQLFYGDGFVAGEIGHIEIVENGEPCLCGRYGCLETLASSQYLARQVRKLASTDSEANIHQFIDTLDDINTNTICQAYQTGDPAIAAIIHEIGLTVGKAMKYVVGALNIHRVVIAGSLARFGNGLIDPIQEQMNKGILSGQFPEIQLEVSELGDDIVILGAAAMLLNRELGLT